MKVALTADLHGFLPEIPDADLLLIAGDIGLGPREAGPAGLSDVAAWLGNGVPERVVAIAGNHDFDSTELSGLPWTYLHDSGTQIDGLNIWGCPWSPTFGPWAWMRPDADLARTWNEIPPETDVLIVHGPPAGVGDMTERGVRAGSRTQRNWLEYGNHPNLKLLVCGHIHEGYGADETVNGVRVINASHVDERYRPVNAPIVVEL